MRYILFIVIFSFLFVSCEPKSRILADITQSDADNAVSDSGQIDADATSGESDTAVIDTDTSEDGSDISTGDSDAEQPDSDGGAASSWKAIAAGYSHTCAIRSDSKLYCWGYNAAGQVGDGTNGVKDTPVKISDYYTWLQVEAGIYHTCGIKTDKTLYCWGYNKYGQLGDGTVNNLSLPTKVGTNIWSAITAGGMHTCGITASDSRLYCWGNNEYGQLGYGTIVNSQVPIKIGDEAWSLIAAGQYNTCGIKTADKKLYCWGYNLWGQIGDGTSGSGTQKNTPVKISDDVWLKISVGNDSVCGIKGDKKLYCWGNNGDGQLGDGTRTDYDNNGNIIGNNNNKNVPSKIGDDTWLEITAKGFHTCGIKEADGKLYCWGSNIYGKLGDGTVTTFDSGGNIVENNNKLSPVKIGGDTWLAIIAGGGHTCGMLETDRKLYCWGWNETGQLGDGTKIDRHIPTLVGEP